MAPRPDSGSKTPLTRGACGGSTSCEVAAAATSPPHRLGHLADCGVGSLGRALYHLASIHHAEWFATGGQEPLDLAAALLERATLSPWPYNAPAYIALAATRVAAGGTAAATWARGWVGE